MANRVSRMAQRLRRYRTCRSFLLVYRIAFGIGVGALFAGSSTLLAMMMPIATVVTQSISMTRYTGQRRRNLRFLLAQRTRARLLGARVGIPRLVVGNTHPR